MSRKSKNELKSLIIFGIIIALFVILSARLADIQLLNGSVYEELAVGNKSYSIVSPDERGVILDRYGSPMIYNKPVYYKLDSDQSLYSERTRIDHQEAMEVMSENSDLIRVDLEREYLYPKSLSHVLGYVGNVSIEDLSEDNGLHISDRIGKFGVEKEFQNLLRGTKSSKIYEINALGQKQHLIAEEIGDPGKNVSTTIDPHLSEVALRAMGENNGAVVILDASNSEVLTLLSTPSFDSSVLSESSNNEEVERERMLKISDFFTNPQKLFFNRAISGAYPPGSVFKLITALAGLEGKKIDSSTSVLDEGVLKVGDYSYANWYFTQFGGKEGEISLVRALARSNDIYFYKVAEWVGPEKLKEMASLFSLGEKTGVELQGEVSGVIPDPEWKQRVIGERWFLGNTYHMGIGQGDILVSPIQIAQMIQALANKGNLCKATLSKDSAENQSILNKNRCSEVGVLEENINLVLEGMLDACSTGGTGFPFFAHNESVFEEGLSAVELIEKGAVACKTGTSEFGAANDSGYRKTHAWFSAILGTKDLIEETSKDEVESGQSEEDSSANKLISDREVWLDKVKEKGFPEKIVIVVLVESDEVNPYKEGSRDAGPVAKEIFDWIKGDIKLPTQN